MENLNDMMVFATVVEKGSFTAAALAFDLPKSNISRKITRLEQSIGARLLERSTRTQRLTEVGKVYYAHCLRIQEEMQSAELSVNSLMSSPRGIMRVCASIAVGQSLLAPCLAEFKQQYPEVQIELTLTNRRVDLIEEDFDLVLRVGKLADSNLVAKKLCVRELHLYASPHYLQTLTNADIAIKTPEQLSELACLVMQDLDKKNQWRLIKAKEECVIAIKPAFSSDDFNVLRQLAQDDAGIAVLPDYMCQEAIEQGKLSRVLPEWLYKQVDIYAIYPSHKGATPKLRVLLEYLVRRFQSSSIS